MDKVRRDRRKYVHTRLDFGEGPRERTREDSHHSSARARTTKPERLKVQARLRLDTSNEDCPKDRERFRSVGESYDDSFSHSYRDGNRSRHMKRRRDNESPLSSVSKSNSSDGRYRKSRSKRQKSTDEDDLTRPWMCEEEDLFTPRIRFDELRPESIDSYKDLKAAFLVYFMQQKKYVKDPVEIHNIKQKDGETIEDFMERFKVETRRTKGAPKSSKKKGHTSWKAQDQSKRQTLDKRSDFRGHSREGRRSNWFTPLTRMPKEILAAEAGKIQPSPPMVTQVEKRSSNKFCDFHNDKGHNTDESSSGTKGPLVIEVEMGGHMIHRMYVDGGSSMKILYEHCFNRLLPEIKNQMVLATTSLTSFSGETIWPMGQLRLLVTIGDADHSTRAWMNFMIVRSLSPYNGIIGRPGIREIQAVPPTAHRMLKFLVEGGIVTIRSTILIPTKCTLVITSSAVSKEERTRSDNFKVALRPDFPNQEVAIEGTLSEKGRTELCSILKKNLDIFTWQPSDMTGDYYPLPEINWKVKSLCGYPFKCFLDTYKGYHHIQLAEPNEEKSAFHTGQGVYCYTKMHFGLKNAGATYQRLMDKDFDSQISWDIEVYVKDLVVKSYTEAEMLRDIDETFCTLRKINLKLNPKKCTFGVAEGVFLGYVVTPDGIKPCSDKTEAVLQLPSPRTIKEV
uniref:Reverse transcriptase domain-containing protein n=1 Tax=Tanacetum cinerariifolium TaxID=118510 RepID=A0A6L2L5V4_TANCI|nr:reverse transcriptase domain-containing protein [Tanacetum cinerariifolium]